MRYLVATDSVHTTAAACDYLDGRLDSDDIVDVLTVVEPTDGESRSAGVIPEDSESASRDAGDAANVAAVRLAGRATVNTLTREGSAAETIRTVVVEHDVDVVVVGTHGGRPDTDPGLGSVTRGILEEGDCPVVVVPLPSQEP